MLTLIAVGFVLIAIREVVGLGGIISGMSDPYAWGLWKTFNVMVLTGLGSGGFAVGIAAWIFNNAKAAFGDARRAAYQPPRLLDRSVRAWRRCGPPLELLLGDAGPGTWNLHSPLLEIAVCIVLYATVPLFLENLPPLFEYVIYEYPKWRGSAEFCENVMTKVYPFIIGLAYILPIMHQSSLGALMILGGNRVNTLWQTPFLPLIYVWAAAFLGYNCVVLCLLLAKLAWKRDVDPEVLAELNKLTVWVVVHLGRLSSSSTFWYAERFSYLFTDGYYSLLFWIETTLIAGSAYVLSTEKGKKLRTMFLAHAACALGGMIYRFAPTTLAFHAKDGATFYFPSAIELIVCCRLYRNRGVGLPHCG